MSTLFISDLHLDPSRPAVIRAFLDLLKQRAVNADVDALYILGDFFEVWIGDDDDAELNRSIVEALRELTNTGTPVYIMHGNRDFLIGERFCQESGCQLLADPTVIELYGKPRLLMHGDSLCTRDARYMTFRAEVRSPAWQSVLLSKSVEERRAIAAKLREDSKDHNSNKAEDITDVTPEEVVSALQQHGADLMVHGHTHRPQIHSLSVNNNPATRIVLGDWDQFGWILCYQPDHSFELEKFSI